MRKTGEWGKFFPGHFAPNPYDESCSGFHFPLPEKQQKEQGFRAEKKLERKAADMMKVDDIPDCFTAIDTKTESLVDRTIWDAGHERPFRITKEDIAISSRLKIPLPYTYYIKRMQENFRWMPFNGELRTARCAKSGTAITTSWPEEYDGRILSEEEYLKVVM